MKLRDRTGERYGLLVAVAYLGNQKWLCKCDCGNESIVNVRSLNRGTRSCGCLKTSQSSRLEDLSGQRFGRLVPKKYIGNERWKCVCDCGNTTIVKTYNLKSGHTSSCGCYQDECRTTHNGSDESLYSRWCNMKSRCFNPKNENYHNYGGRGITVCQEWRDSYEAFREWAYSSGYDPRLTVRECSLDRIDVNGNYEPNNCRWTDSKTQAMNKRVGAGGGAPKPVVAIDSRGNIVGYYKSIKKASEVHQCAQSSISQVVNGHKQTLHGLRWSFADNINEEELALLHRQSSLQGEGVGHGELRLEEPQARKEVLWE